MAAMTSSTASSGTSTSENRSAISMAPMSRPLRPVSLAMAPTRSLGRMPRGAAGADEEAGPPSGAAAGRRARGRPRSPRSPLPDGRPSRARRRSLVPVAAAVGGRASAWRRPSGISSSSSWPPLRARAPASPRPARPRPGRTRRPAPRPRRGTGRGRPSSSARASAARVSSIRRARRSATVGTFSIAIFCLGDALDVLEHAVLAGLGQRDGHALAPGPADPADAVDVGLRRRRHVVVDDVGELVDVEAAGGDVGGDEQVGGAGAQPAHDPVALLLVHAAVQRLGPVARGR